MLIEQLFLPEEMAKLRELVAQLAAVGDDWSKLPEDVKAYWAERMKRADVREEAKS